MTLAELIAADPDGMGYTSMSDDQISVDLHVPRHTITAPIDMQKFVQRMYDDGTLLTLIGAKNDVSNPVHMLAIEAMDMIETASRLGLKTIDTTKVTFISLMAAMESASVITTTQKDSYYAMAQTQGALLDVHGITGNVNHITIAEARTYG